MRVLSRNGTKNAECACDSIASTFDRELDDVLRIKIDRTRSEGSACRVFNSLIDGKDGHIARSRQASGARELTQAHQHSRRTIRHCPDTIDEVRAREMK